MKRRFFIYLRRQALTPDRLVDAAGLSRADALRVVKSRLPQTVAACDSADEARAFLEGLRAKGLSGFAITSEALRRFSPRPVTNGNALRSGTVRMIVVGKIHSEKETRTGGEMNGVLSAGMGMAYMGGPVSRTRLFAYETKTVSRDEESFCCLFRSADDASLILESRFEYRSTLAPLPPTREQSFLAVVRIAREVHPEAAFDDSLYRFPAPVRLFGGQMRNLGGAFTDVVESTKEGSSRDRALQSAHLLYLQSCR